MSDNYVQSCVYCGEPTAGEEGGYYSLTTNLEVCAKSPTSFHERSRYDDTSNTEYQRGLCAGCFQMEPLQLGNDRCDYCMSMGSPWLIWRQDDDDD